MSELKRCPFCDGLPLTKVQVTSMGGDSDQVDFSVICENCGTHKTVRLYINKYANFTDIEKAMIQVNEKWNTRAYEDNRVIAKIKSSGHPCGVFGDCPICGGYCVNEDPYCPHCGTKLEWE